MKVRRIFMKSRTSECCFARVTVDEYGFNAPDTAVDTNTLSLFGEHMGRRITFQSHFLSICRRRFGMVSCLGFRRCLEFWVRGRDPWQVILHFLYIVSSEQTEMA